MTKHRRVSTVSAVIFAHLFLGCLGTDADENFHLQKTNTTHIDQHGIVHYAFDPDSLPGAIAAIRKGVNTLQGQCEFLEEGAGQADETGPQVIVHREVEFDPAACTRTIAIAQYRVFDMPNSVRERLGSIDTEEQASDGPLSEGVSYADKEGTEYRSATTRWYSGMIKVNVEDPPQIDVTTTRSSLSWTGGSCVTSSQHDAHWGWYSPSGWGRKDYSWAHDRNCSRAYTNTVADYKNGIFCVGIDTWTHHDKTWFEVALLEDGLGPGM